MKSSDRLISSIHTEVKNWFLDVEHSQSYCDCKSQLLQTHQCMSMCWGEESYWPICLFAHRFRQKCSPGQSNCSLHRSRAVLSEELPGECKLFLLVTKLSSTLPFLLLGFLELSGAVVTTPLLPSWPPVDLPSPCVPPNPLDDLSLSRLQRLVIVLFPWPWLSMFPTLGVW